MSSHGAQRGEVRVGWGDEREVDIVRRPNGRQLMIHAMWYGVVRWFGSEKSSEGASDAG